MTRITRSGNYSVDHSYETVFRVLSDPEVMVRCIPDSSEITDQGDSTVEATVKTGTGAVSVRLELAVTLDGADRETGMIRYVGTGSGPRSHVSFSGTFYLLDRKEHTVVEWDCEVTVHGMLVALGEQIGRYEPIIDEKITTAVENVQSRVTAHD